KPATDESMASLPPHERLERSLCKLVADRWRVVHQHPHDLKPCPECPSGARDDADFDCALQHEARILGVVSGIEHQTHSAVDCPNEPPRRMTIELSNTENAKTVRSPEPGRPRPTHSEGSQNREGIAAVVYVRDRQRDPTSQAQGEASRT